MEPYQKPSGFNPRDFQQQHLTEEEALAQALEASTSMAGTEIEHKPVPNHQHRKVERTYAQSEKLPPRQNHAGERSKAFVPQQASSATLSQRELKLLKAGKDPFSGSVLSSGQEEFSPSQLHHKNTASFSEKQHTRLLTNAEKVLTKAQFEVIQPLIRNLVDTANRQYAPFTSSKLLLVKTAVDNFLKVYDSIPEMLESNRGGLSDKIAKSQEGSLMYVLHTLAEDIYSLLHLDVVQLATADLDSPNDQLQILATLKKRAEEMPAIRQSHTQVSTTFGSLQQAIQQAIPEGVAVIPLNVSMSVCRCLGHTLKETLGNSALIKQLESLDINAVATAMKPVLLAELCQTPELAYNQQLVGSIRTEFTPRCMAVTSGMTVFEQKRYLNMLIGTRSAQHIVTSAKQEFEQQWQLAIKQVYPQKQAGERRTLLAVCSGQEFVAQAGCDQAIHSIVQSKGSEVVQKTLEHLRSCVIKQPAVEPPKDRKGTWLAARVPERLQIKTGAKTYEPSQGCLLMATGEMPPSAIEGEDPTTVSVMMHFKKRELVKQSELPTLVYVGEESYKAIGVGRKTGYGSVMSTYKDRDLYKQLPHASQEMIPTEEIARRTRLQATREGDSKENLDDFATTRVSVSK